MWIGIGIVFILGIWIGSAGHRSNAVQSSAQEDVQSVQWWTCSMHPQIKLPEPGKCPICFMDLIPLESGDNSDIGLRELKMSETAVKLAEIETEPVRRGKPVASVRLSGTIEPDERNIKTITAWVPGRLEKLFVDFTGSEVKKGDPLVELYSPDLYSAQEELIQALSQSGMNEDSDESAGVLVQAAREKLRQLGLTEDQLLDLEKRGTASERIVIVSPISGIVLHKTALQGNYVSKGSPIYTITDLSSVWAVLDACEKDVALLKTGQTASFEVEAIPGKTFPGKIRFIDPVLDAATRSVQVRLDVSNPQHLLKPGMFIRAVVHAVLPGEKTEPLLVPASAVLKTGMRAVVYVRKANANEPVFEGREVLLGGKAGNDYVVLSGLEEGEQVVVQGNFKIDSAMQIQAKPSMMTPASEPAESINQPNEKPPMAADMNQNAIPHASPEFKSTLKPVYAAYFSMQRALAKDDFKSARNAAIAMRPGLSSVSSGNTDWNGIRTELSKPLEHARHWPDIEAARKAFDTISQQIIRLEKEFGPVRSETTYRAFCPMAFDNKGAEWLQTDSTIANPYLGQAMPKCGEIKEKIEPNHP